jgi:hypothetical protein
MTAPTFPKGVSKTGSVEPSPKPQTSRSEAVGMTLRCFSQAGPVRREKQDRTIQGARIPLHDTDDQKNAIGAGSLAETFHCGPRNLDTTFPVAAKVFAAFVGTRTHNRAEIQPSRIRADEGLWKEDEFCPLRSRVFREAAKFLQSFFEVKRDRSGLYNGNFESARAGSLADAIVI